MSAASVSRVGQSVAYTFVVRNSGSETLRGLLVSAPVPGVSALVCSPVPLGGTLTAGATTTCRATRTTTLADLRLDTLTGTAKASGTASTQVVRATAAVTVAVHVVPPRPVAGANESGGAVVGASSVLLPGSTKDLPGQLGGPPIDPTRTEFTGAPPCASCGPADGLGNSPKHVTVDGNEWWVLPDGSVRFRAEGTPGVATVDYRVYDTSGHSAVGHLKVVTHAGATCSGAFPPVAHPTLPDQPITVDVLAPCDPGQNADGTKSAFDPSSVQLVSPGGNGATLSYDHKHLSITDPELDSLGKLSVRAVGEYTVNSDGTVTFAPAPDFRGAVAQVEVTAATTASSTVTSVISIGQVTLPQCQTGSTCWYHPAAPALTKSTAYRHPVVFPAAASTVPLDPALPIVPSTTAITSSLYVTTPVLKVISTYQGTWRVNDKDGSVTFSPADGFVGTTAVITYDVADRAGDHGQSTLVAHVQLGPRAVPDFPTGDGDLFDIAPLANDVPGPHADGTQGSFVTASLVLPTLDQPAGAVLAGSGNGQTLTVPGEGVWTLDRDAPMPLSFSPVPGFAGGTTPISYQVTDDSGNVTTGRITGTLTGNDPAATDDEVSTTLATAVTLPGLTNDIAGVSPLVVDATVFPTTGQPPSATLSADGKSVSVPAQGTWTLAADGSALFTPTPTYAGTTTPVTYRILDTAGRSSTATLRVTVQGGPAGHAQVLPAPGDDGSAQVVLSDAAGRNADGTRGSIDPSSVRIVTDGQPKGWTVAPDGHSATYGTGDQRILAEAESGGFSFVALGHDVTATVGPLTYTAQNTVLDATGAVRHHRLRSTVEASLTHLVPIATNDHADTTSGTPVFVAGPSNDLTVSGSLDPDKTVFPSDQLDRLPGGSTVSGDGRTLTVKGEGVYSGGARVYFVPAKGFLGNTTPIRYQVTDEWGNTARATVTVTVHPVASARPDAVTTPRNHPVTVDVAADDDPGHLPGGYGSYAGATPYPQLPVHGLPTGWTGNGYGTRLTVPGEGVYVVDLGSTSVTFTPEPRFSGTASPITLDLGPSFSSGPELTSVLTVTVTASVPRAASDTATTNVSQPVIVPVLANDSAGPGATLVGSSVRLRLTPGLPDGSALADDGTTLTVPGDGVFLVAGDGEITFVPSGSGPASALVVGYQVADTNGTTAQATVTVRPSASRT